MGTTINVIRHTTTKPMIIFNLQFLQYMIRYSSVAFWLNWNAWSKYCIIYLLKSRTFFTTILIGLDFILFFLCYHLLMFLSIMLRDFTSSKFDCICPTLSTDLMFSYFVHVYWIVAFTWTFNDDFSYVIITSGSD